MCFWTSCLVEKSYETTGYAQTHLENAHGTKDALSIIVDDQERIDYHRVSQHCSRLLMQSHRLYFTHLTGNFILANCQVVIGTSSDL